MRAFVVAGLVVFHSAVVFAAGTSWFVKDPQPSAGFTVFLLWGSLWGMPLLFLVSGMGARYAMRTRPAAAFARERLARLGSRSGRPGGAGPADVLLGRLAQPGFHEPYWRFWLGFVNVPRSPEGCCRAGLDIGRGRLSTRRTCGSCMSCWSFPSRCCRCLPTCGARGAAAHRAAGRFRRAPGGVVVWAAAIPLMAVEAVFGPMLTPAAGNARLRVPVPVRVPDRLRPAVGGCAAALPLAALAVACAATGALVAWAGALRRIARRLAASRRAGAPCRAWPAGRGSWRSWGSPGHWPRGGGAGRR